MIEHTEHVYCDGLEIGIITVEKMPTGFYLNSKTIVPIEHPSLESNLMDEANIRALEFISGRAQKKAK